MRILLFCFPVQGSGNFHSNNHDDLFLLQVNTSIDNKNTREIRPHLHNSTSLLYNTSTKSAKGDVASNRSIVRGGVFGLDDPNGVPYFERSHLFGTEKQNSYDFLHFAANVHLNFVFLNEV